MPILKHINVMVGITRNKIIILFDIFSGILSDILSGISFGILSGR